MQNNQELEAKILEIDREKIIDIILKNGGKKVFDGDMFGVFFDTPNSQLKFSRKLLRLRKEGDKNFLTYKCKISNFDIKIQEENEIEIPEFEKMRDLLNSIGFEEIKTNLKHRTSFKINNVKIELDKYLGELDFIPEFLEIEAPTREEIYDTAILLGYIPAELKSWTSFKLEMFYREVYNLHDD
jgi:adenylate cyclase class 2